MVCREKMKYSSEDLLIFRNIFILTKPSLKRGIEESICQPQNCPSIIILPFNLRHSFKIFTFDIIFIVFIQDGSLQSLSRYMVAILHTYKIQEDHWISTGCAIAYFPIYFINLTTLPRYELVKILRKLK